MNDRTLERIRKLLALGTSPSPAEAQAAMAKAKELADAAGLEIQDAYLKGESAQPAQPDLVDEHLETPEKNFTLLEKYIQSTLNRYFNVYMVKRSGSKTSIIVGTPDNIAFARYVHGFLHETVQRLWAQWRRLNPFLQRGARNDYLTGFFAGLSEQLQREVDERSRQTRAAGYGDRYAIVLKDEADRLRRVMHERFDRIRAKASRVSTAGDGITHQAGYHAGRRTTVNRPVSGGSSGMFALEG